MSKRKAIKVPKTPSPLLPTECMEQIFKHVLEMESARLHPSLLVNRYWCKNVVPFLWTRPFALVSNQDCYKLLRTFLLCLDIQEHNLLNCLLKPYKIKIPSSNKRTTFNYPIYLQELSLKDLEVCIASTIHKWYGKSSYDGYYPYQMEILINSLLRLFFRGSTNLRFLNFNQYFNFLDILDSTELFSQTQYGLSQLTRLQIVNNEPITRNTIHFLKLLSITCKQIHSLEIRLQSFDYSTEVINHFTNLITSQRDLMEFSIANIMINFEQIMSSLQSHKICLHSIKLDCVYLTEGSMNLLNNFHNLESLYLYYCEGLTSTLLEGHFNLQNLHIINSLKLQNVTLSMLQVYGNSLRQLGLNIHDLEVSGDMAFECCQNINELVLIIYNPTHLSGYDTWKTEKWKERLDTLILTQKINLSTLSIRDQTI
ncbi:15610_t:CDS:1 [Funneliformis mosseae]|uniref:15610_t:CDS:1 n=1 Tax=Funneliformis mosseae TaxID=27381 RepID=A0A9N9DE27_FUNMO|nr:15610_t:CDS:1 [Funneliformis mosseae]